MKYFIVSHGDLAMYLKKTSQMILGEQENLYALCLDENLGVADYCRQLDEMLLTLNDGESILVMCDVIHGTPFNQSQIKICGHEKNFQHKTVSGVNLPMLLEVCTRVNTNISLDEMAQIAIQAGREGICEYLVNTSVDEEL
jgi:mannose/fructose/sorbose-specific phosphotransferase system IIA component